MDIKEIQRKLEQRRKSDERVCAFMGFGKTEPHICRCDEEERKWCRENYAQIKKDQYIDSKGQKSFKRD